MKNIEVVELTGVFAKTEGDIVMIVDYLEERSFEATGLS